MSTDTHLPPRELAVLERLAAGSTNEQIAETLGIGRRTVENMVQRLFIRLRVENRVQAARWFWENREPAA